jgi:four helix bundle protein
MRRATKSICANVSEGFNKQKYSVKEFVRFLVMAEASAAEIHVWLDYARDLGYIAEADYLTWYDDYDAIGAMLNKLRQALR